jgi:hypothetical protein
MVDRAEQPDAAKPADEPAPIKPAGGVAPIKSAGAPAPIKDMLGSATAAISIISSAAFILSVVYERAYFSLVGDRFQSIASLTDYLTAALDWLPWAILLLLAYGTGAILFNAVIDPGRTKIRESNMRAAVGGAAAPAPAPAAGEEDGRQEKAARLWIITSSIAGFLLFGGLALGVYLKGDPASDVQDLTGYCCLTWISIVLFVFRRKETQSRLGAQALWALFLVPPIMGGAYGLGLQAGYRDLSPPGETYTLVRKDASAPAKDASAQGKNSPSPTPEQVSVLRTFERGVLVRLPQQQVSQFLRWDEVRYIGLPREGAAGKSLGCRQLAWFC